MVILRGRKIKKVFGKKSNTQEVLKDIDIEVREGEFVGIMGPSGSGKTTLLNVLASIDKVTSGIIEINNNNLQKMKEQKLSKLEENSLVLSFRIIICWIR